VDQDATALSIIQSIENAGLQDVADELRTYWDSVLSSNCQANVVIAQILAADNVGRYVEAPVGLARALETFLDGKAESTVKVHVTDGTINLLSVDLAVEVKTTADFSSAELQQQVVANVSTSLQDQLIGRSYGESLRISDLYSVVEGIEGVDYAHLTITNQPTRVNSYGDLPIETYEVITLGVLPVITLL
jgi:predicted TIM-barrel enzyme